MSTFYAKLSSNNSCFSHFPNKISAILLTITIIVSATLMLSSAYQESAIMDELAHIPAGYSYDKFLDYRLNPEHPPLVKSLSALPLLILNLKFPLESSAWQSDVNGQWDAGNQFIYKVNGQKADKIIFLSRIFPILLTLLLVIFVYWWSKKIIGPIWALLPAFFVAFSPNILAHGHYVTTDIGAALGFFIGLYAYSNYLKNPSRKNLWTAGIAFGISQMLKFSTVLLVPLLIFFSLVYWWLKSKSTGNKIFGKESIKMLWKYLGNLILIFLIGYLLVWIFYIIFTLNYPAEKQKSDTISILTSFGGGPDPQWQKCPPKGLGMRCLANIDIWLSSKPILRAIGHYLLGVLMVIQRSSGGNTTYFLGQISGDGKWYYFPIVYLLKESLPVLIFLAIGMFTAAKRIYFSLKERSKEKFVGYLSENFELFMIISTVIFYWAYSIKSNLNIGFRHILPTLPLIYILASVSFKKWFEKNRNLELSGWLLKIAIFIKNAFSRSLKLALLLFLMIWLLVEVFISYPYFLSYFNEIGGGVWGGYKHVTDSNYDWGQDLKRLKSYVEKNNIDKIAVDYFGGGDINYYLGDKAVPWWSAKGNPLDQNIKWLAISANTIQSAKAVPDEKFIVHQENTYPWLETKPIARAGTSIFIYKLK